MERQYTVALQDGKVLPGRERIAAELRFINTLERMLGDPAEVVAAYKAWIAAGESQAADIDRTTAALAVRWPPAYERATQAGLTGVHGVDEAEFDVVVGKSR
jgi:hypothetical protein